MSTVDAGRAIPTIAPFAVVRREPFGALLFNPYLGVDVRLDEAETRAFGLCDGERTVDQMYAEAEKRFGLRPPEARSLVDRALRKAFSITIADLSRVPVPGAGVRLPDEPPDPSCMSAPKRAVWEVTYRCNLRCHHCTSDAGRPWASELTTEQGLALIDALAEAKILLLLLSGGEPLLRKDILILLEGLASTNIRIDLATNGLELPDPFMKRLPDLPLYSAQVSLDGIGKAHDQFRGREGSFAAACQSITRLKEAGLAITVSYTATRENLSDLDALVDLAVELGCREFKVTPFRPIGRGRRSRSRYSLDTADVYRMNRQLAARKKELAGQLHINFDSCFPFLLEKPLAYSNDVIPMGCSAGEDTILIEADGTAYPCAFMREHPLGNVLEEGLDHIWRQSPAVLQLRALRKRDMKEPCGSCPYAPLQCGGGCRAAAFYEHGDLTAPDPSCYRPLVERS